MTTTLQLEYTEDELLASHDYVEPLFAGGVRCHGGFAADGTYVSPRTKHRVPAIEAWQRHHSEQFGTELFDLPLDSWPAHYPTVEQARFLVQNGVPQPIIATLTRIGTVEGFGSMIRYSVLPELQKCFEEDIRGTATAHLEGGLYEAHARDEAGYGDEGGHKQMWFAARDIAFENPVTEDETMNMLARMGIAAGYGDVSKAPDLNALRDAAIKARKWPADVSFDLEVTVERMARLVLIEISAFHTFAWAETLLSDRDLVAGDGEPARLVSYIRADETPHVEYLKTVLSEMRDRTFIGESGRRYPGHELVGMTWDAAVKDSLGARSQELRRITRNEILHAVEGRKDANDVVAQFDSLGPAEVAA